MQSVEITLRYIVAAASLAVAADAFCFQGVSGALPAVLAAVLVAPALDPLLHRLFPELAGMTGQVQALPGQGVLRTVGALLLTTLRMFLCFAGLLGSLYVILHTAKQAALRLEHAPSIEYRDQVTLDGAIDGLGRGQRDRLATRLQLNGRAVAVEAGRFMTRQPLQMGLNTFRMVLEGPGAEGKPSTVEKTVIVRRVSEEEYDQETFGHNDCSLSGPEVHHSGAWGPGFPSTRFSGSSELHAARLRGRCVQELTATRLPLRQQSAEVELQASLGRGRVKVLLRHPDGKFERLLVTPGQPLHYSGTVALEPMTNTVTQPGNPSEGTPATTSIEEFWVAYISLESLSAEDGAAPGADSEDAAELVFNARYALR